MIELDRLMKVDCWKAKTFFKSSVAENQQQWEFYTIEITKAINKVYQHAPAVFFCNSVLRIQQLISVC